MDYYDSRSTNGASGALYTVLECCIEDILSLIKPLESDRSKRLNTIDDLERVIQSIGTLKGATVKPFGSFVSNLYSKWGDLDISISLNQRFNSSANRSKKQNLLREIMRTLRKEGISRKIQFIPQARVPLLVYESKAYGVSCDVSVDNHQGRVKSKILELITSLDERFTDMVLLIKEWAKAQDINDPKTGTLNSYSLCLLVIFHFQTCEPAILPPLKRIYKGNVSDDVEGVETEREQEIEDICALNVKKFISRISSHRNQSSLTNLVVSFFDKVTLVYSLKSKHSLQNSNLHFHRSLGKNDKQPKMDEEIIEDPFEQPDNSARAVSPHNLRTIGGVFRATHQFLSSSSVLSDRNSLFRLLSRPLVSSQLSAPKKPTYTHHQSSLHQYPNMKGTQQGNESVVGYCVSAFAEPSLNQARTTRIRTTGNAHTDPNESTQLVNGDLNLTHDYRNGFYDPNLTHNHRHYPVGYSAQFSDRFGTKMNGSHRTGRTIVEPKRDNLARNGMASGVRGTGMASVQPAHDPSLTSNHESRQLVGYHTTPPGSTSRNYDTGMNGMMHRTGLAIVEPITEQFHSQLKLNGQSYGSRSNKGKQIWQPKFATNQDFL